MRVANKAPFSKNGFFSLKDNDWLERQRVAGKIAATCLVMLENAVANKSEKSLLELSKFTEDFILKNNCTPTFKNYKGFPEAVCISVNTELVHGIPKDYILQEGDVVSFDLGATFEGAIADTAITCIYGKPKIIDHQKIIDATNEALYKGIDAIKVGNRLGCIGDAIYRSAKGNGFKVINNYGGHGLDWNIPHAAPFVANKADPNEGLRIQPGLVLAVEPMLVPSSTHTKVLNDGWTVATQEIGAHFEHSLYIHEDHVEIITSRLGMI